MSRILVVRPSSLGDVVYALALVDDVLAHDPHAQVGWVAEEAFASLVGMDRRVAPVVPVAFRRWRTRPLAAATWREFRAFRSALRAERYDVILDLQEQVKGGLIARMARGRRHGLDRQSIREPIATLFDDVHHRIGRDLHFVDKCRSLAGAALGYAVTGPPRWHFTVPTAGPALPVGPYALVFHATSRADKLWPEAHWRALLARFADAGLATLLPWGSADEEARSHRIAAGAVDAIVPARQSLPALAALARSAHVVVGVDTGLTHLAAALGAPTVAIFAATDPRLAGVARVGAHAQDVGDARGAPSFDAVAAAAGRALRTAPQC